jgi:Ca-activated chloride channel family protein
MRNKVIIGAHMRSLMGLQKVLFISAMMLVLVYASSAQSAANAAVSTPAAQPPSATPAAPTAATEQKSGDAKQADPNDADQEAVATIKTQVREVNVIFTVTDKHGRFKKDLKQEDLQILDDGKAPEQIRDFRSETDLPLRVGLLVDASNSIRDRFKFEQEAATEFLNSIVRPRQDLAFVIGFDSTPEVTQDFTSDTEKLSNGIRMLRPGGGTALFDAVYYACRDKLMKQKDKSTVRRAIILVSDGDDNQSHSTLSEAIEMAQRAEVIIYTISTSTSNSEDRGDKYLRKLAENTGGRAFTPFKIQDVSDAFRDIQDELRSQYAVAYKPADFRADGHFRPIQISAENNKKLFIRARRGYYAPMQQ